MKRTLLAVIFAVLISLMGSAAQRGQSSAVSRLCTRTSRTRHVDQPRQGVVATALELHRAFGAKLDAIAAKLKA